jgi:hypothetical protein
MFRGTNEAKRREWAERLERYRRSGQTVAAFCSHERVAVPTFYQWKRKLANDGASRPTRNNRRGFKPVRITSAGQAARVSVRLPDGIVIELDNDASATREIIELILDRQAGAV